MLERMLNCNYILVIRAKSRMRRIRPGVISKINTALQIAVLVVVLLVAAGVPAGSHFVLVLSMVTFATTVASGADYLARFARQAWHLPAR